MKRLMIVCVAVAMIGAASPLIAGSPVKMGTFPIPLMVENKDKGVFVELTQEVARRAAIPIDIRVFPPQRTINSFSQKKVAGIFPALDVTNPGPVSKSTPIYIKVDYIFYKKGNRRVSIQDLEGRRVGLTRGYPYVKELTGNPKIRIELANDDETNMKKLAAGRIDAFVVEEKTGLAAIKKSGVTGIEYDPAHKLSEQQVYYAFQPTAEGKQTAEKFSQALKSMQKDGTFSQIMAKAK